MRKIARTFPSRFCIPAGKFRTYSGLYTLFRAQNVAIVRAGLRSRHRMPAAPQAVSASRAITPRGRSPAPYPRIASTSMRTAGFSACVGKHRQKHDWQVVPSMETTRTSGLLATAPDRA